MIPPPPPNAPRTLGPPRPQTCAPHISMSPCTVKLQSCWGWLSHDTPPPQSRPVIVELSTTASRHLKNAGPSETDLRVWANVALWPISDRESGWGQNRTNHRRLKSAIVRYGPKAGKRGYG